MLVAMLLPSLTLASALLLVYSLSLSLLCPAATALVHPRPPSPRGARLRLWAKPTRTYVCEGCGQEHLQRVGLCSACGEWNTVKVVRLPSSSASKLDGILGRDVARLRRPATKSSHGTLIDLASARETVVADRIQLWSREVNNVFGGGLVRGSVVLIAGDPGVGKSTLLLQLSSSVADSCAEGVIYLSGEENADQILSRVTRLRIPSKNIKLLCDTDVDASLNTLMDLPARPALLIVDSIQMMRTQSGGGVGSAGSVSQVRDCTALLVEFAKTTGTSVVLVGHVTKNGEVAGPRVLEHMVDTVLYLEASEGKPSCRLLRCIKNRSPVS